MKKSNRPKNLFSYQDGQPFLGLEFKEWVNYNLEHQGSQTKLAKIYERYLKGEDIAPIQDTRLYCFVSNPLDQPAGAFPNRPLENYEKWCASKQKESVDLSKNNVGSI